MAARRFLASTLSPHTHKRPGETTAARIRAVQNRQRGALASRKPYSAGICVSVVLLDAEHDFRRLAHQRPHQWHWPQDGLPKTYALPATKSETCLSFWLDTQVYDVMQRALSENSIQHMLCQFCPV